MVSGEECDCGGKDGEIVKGQMVRGTVSEECEQVMRKVKDI